MTTSPAPTDAPVAPRPAFASIACAVDGCRGDAEAVRQAAVLAGLTGPLDLFAVAWEIGTGATAQATITVAHADRALEAAAQVAGDAGAHPQTRRLENPDA